MRTNLKKFIVFVLSLAMVLTTVPMTAFAVEPVEPNYTVQASVYTCEGWASKDTSTSSSAASNITLGALKLNDPMKTEESCFEGATASAVEESYFEGTLYTTGGCYKFDATKLVVATDEAVKISGSAFNIPVDVYGTLIVPQGSSVGGITVYEGGIVKLSNYDVNACTVTGKGGTVIVGTVDVATSTSVKLSGEFCSVSTEKPGNITDPDADKIELIGNTTVGAVSGVVTGGAFNVATTGAYNLTLQNDAKAYLHDETSVGTINVYNATLYVEDNYKGTINVHADGLVKVETDLTAGKIVGYSGIVDVDDGTTTSSITANIEGSFAKVTTGNASYENQYPSGMDKVALVGATTVGAIDTETGGSFRVNKTNTKNLTLKKEATAWLDDTDCGSTINVYDATLHVRKDNDSEGTVIVGQMAIGTAAAVVYVDDLSSTSAIGANIKGVFASVSTSHQNYAYGDRDYVNAIDDTTIYKSNEGYAKINSEDYLWVMGEDSEYDVYGQENDCDLIVGAPNQGNDFTTEGGVYPTVYAQGVFDGAMLENGKLYWGYQGKLNESSGRHWLTEESKDVRVLEGYIWGAARLFESVTSGASPTSIFLDDNNGGILYWNSSTIVGTAPYRKIDGARVVGSFTNITTSEEGDRDAVVMCGPVQIKYGENDIYTGDYCINPLNIDDDYLNAEGNTNHTSLCRWDWDLVLGSAKLSQEVGHILSYHYGSIFDGPYEHSYGYDFDGSTTLNNLYVFSDSTADVLGVVDDYPIQDNMVDAENKLKDASGVGRFHVGFPYEHSLYIDEIIGVKCNHGVAANNNGGILKVSEKTHKDIKYVADGDYYKYEEATPNVVTPEIFGYFTTIEGGVISEAEERTKINDGSGDIYIYDSNNTLAGNYNDVFVNKGEGETYGPVDVTLSGTAKTVTVYDGVVLVEGQVGTITVEGGTVMLAGTAMKKASAEKVIVKNGGRFIMGEFCEVAAEVATKQYTAVEVNVGGSFYMFDGRIALSPAQGFADIPEMRGVFNAGTAMIDNGTITINGGQNNVGIYNNGTLSLGFYGEYVDNKLDDATSWKDALSGRIFGYTVWGKLNSSVDINLVKGIGIFNGHPDSKTYIYDAKINVTSQGTGIDANDGELYILSGDKTVRDGFVDCNGDDEPEAAIVNTKRKATVEVHVKGAGSVALDIADTVTWAIAGPYQTSVFEGDIALRTESKKTKNMLLVPTGGLAGFGEMPTIRNKWSQIYGNLTSYNVPVQLIGSPLTCGKFIGEINTYNCLLDELFPGTVVDAENLCDKNFYMADKDEDGSLTVVDAEWELRYALESTENQSYSLPIDVQLDLYQDKHGMCSLGDIDISKGFHVLNLNGHTITGEKFKNVIHFISGCDENTKVALFDIKEVGENLTLGSGKILAKGHGANAIVVEGGKALSYGVHFESEKAKSAIVSGGALEVVIGEFDGNIEVESGRLEILDGKINDDVIRKGGEVYLCGGDYYGEIKNVENELAAHITPTDDGMISVNHILYGVKSADDSKSVVNGNFESVSHGAYDYLTIVPADLGKLLSEKDVVLPCNVDLYTTECAICGEESGYAGGTWIIKSTKTLDLNGFVLTNSGNADTIAIAGGDLTITAGSVNGGKILSKVLNASVEDDGYNEYDAIYAIAGKLTVEPIFNGYIYQVHVVDGVQTSVQGGKYGAVYRTRGSNRIAPVYSILPNNLDWYRLTDNTVLERNSEFAASTAALSHGANLDYGERYTVTSAAPSLTLDKASANQTSGNLTIAATSVPTTAKLTWTVKSGDAKLVDGTKTTYSADANITNIVTIKACSVKSVITVQNEYGDTKTFTLNPTYTPPYTPPSGGGYSGGGGGGSISITPPKEEPTKVETVWKDVDPNRYYYDALQWAFDEEIIDGVSASKFGIGNDITRAELFNALYKAAGSPAVDSSYKAPCTDVDPESEYYKAIVWAYANGYTNGATVDYIFAPDMELDRAQIVTILWRYAGSTVQEGKIDFTDVEHGRYYEKAVDWSTANGIINGTGDGTTFSPQEAMLKESAVTMLYRKFVKALF